MTLPSLLDCGQPGFADSDPGMNVIQHYNLKEEVGGDCAQRGRHETTFSCLIKWFHNYYNAM